jgi:hypothetical protein
VPHVVAPAVVPGSPFTFVPIKRWRYWRESALWWPATRTLVVAEAIGTNRFFAAPGERAGVHLLLRLSPPRDALGGFTPDHLLVGHGEGVHGEGATVALRRALARSRREIPGFLARIPAFALDAVRRRG